MSGWFWVPTCKCYQCGKEFQIEDRNTWVYRRYAPKATRNGGGQNRYFCSWGCMRQYDREFVKPIPKRNRKKVVPV